MINIFIIFNCKTKHESNFFLISWNARCCEVVVSTVEDEEYKLEGNEAEESDEDNWGEFVDCTDTFIKIES